MPNIFTLYSGVMISGIVLFLKLMTLRIVRGFHISYKPSVYILAVDTTGAGFSIEVSGFGRGQEDRVLYCINILDAKAEVVFIKLSQKLHLFDGGNL